MSVISRVSIWMREGSFGAAGSAVTSKVDGMVGLNVVGAVGSVSG